LEVIQMMTYVLTAVLGDEPAQPIWRGDTVPALPQIGDTVLIHKDQAGILEGRTFDYHGEGGPRCTITLGLRPIKK
jgi:hypothetical protein